MLILFEKDIDLIRTKCVMIENQIAVQFGLTALSKQKFIYIYKQKKQRKENYLRIRI